MNFMRIPFERLKGIRLAGIPKHEKEIHPFYKGYSIANLPASILRWLEVPPPLDNPLKQTKS